MCFSTPKVPQAVAPPPVAKEQDPAIQAALDSERRLRASRSGFKSTILAGTTPPPASNKTLLGS